MGNDYEFTTDILNMLYNPIFEEGKVPPDFYADMFGGPWQDRRERNPFGDGPTNKKLKVKSEEYIPHINSNLNKMVEMIDGIKQKPELLDKPVIQQFYGFQQDMLKLSASGVDVGRYLSYIPGGNRVFNFVDLRDASRVLSGATGNEAAEKYEEMFRDMGYPTVWEEMKKRVGMEAEMDGKLLSPEQKASYAERITESNKKMIDAYNRMMSDDSKARFKDFYQNFDNPLNGTISGGRGYKTVINGLLEENAALANGWDPTRLADYRIMRKLSNDLKSEELFEAVESPELSDYHNKLQDFISMDPLGKRFENQGEFDSFIHSFHESLNEVIEEAKRPEVKKASKEGLDAYRKKVNPDEPGLDRGESLKRGKMITVAESNMPARLIEENGDALFITGYVKSVTGPKLPRFKAQNELSDALTVFNTKRTDGWLSSESKEHRALREAAEKLQRDMSAYSSGVYVDGPNKGKTLSDFERDNLRDSMEKSLKEMSRAAEVYITKSKNPSTEAGKARLEGARRLAGVTERLGAELSAATRSHDAAAGIEDDFETKMAEAMEFQEKDFLSNDKDLNYIRNMNLKRLQLATRNKPFGTRQDFKNTLSNVIAGKSIDIEIKKHRMSPSPQEATLKMAKAADQLRADPVFNKMADEIFDSPKLKEQLHIMEPGEILAKYLARKQNEKMKETAAQKQQELKKKDPRLGMGGPKK